MKKMFWFLCVILLGASLLVLASNDNTIEPKANIQSIDLITSHPKDTPSKAADDQSNSIRFVPVDTINLDFIPDSDYISEIQFGAKGDVFFSTFSYPRETKLIKYNLRSRQHAEIVIPAIGDAQIGEFYIDREKLYVSLSWPNRAGAIVILESSGAFLSMINTGNFLPAKLIADAEGRIWAAGQLFDSPSRTSTLQDVQIRVYDPTGNLIDIPVNGLDVNEPSLCAFDKDDSTVKMISHTNPAVYEFAGLTLVRARAYPLNNISGQAKDLSGKDAQRVIHGITRLKDLKLWLGRSMRDGVFGQAFIGVTTLAGEPVTPEMPLPHEYQAIAGIDDQGSLYAYNKIGDRLVLNKLRIEFDKTTKSKTGRQ